MLYSVISTAITGKEKKKKNAKNDSYEAQQRFLIEFGKLILPLLGRAGNQAESRQI